MPVEGGVQAHEGLALVVQLPKDVGQLWGAAGEDRQGLVQVPAGRGQGDVGAWRQGRHTGGAAMSQRSSITACVRGVAARCHERMSSARRWADSQANTARTVAHGTLRVARQDTHTEPACEQVFSSNPILTQDPARTRL